MDNLPPKRGPSAAFIPYRYRADSVLEIFVQRRDETAIHAPDTFGFFGGGVESGETPKEAMLREVEEELVYKPKEFTFLGIYGDGIKDRIKHVYCEKVPQGFEDSVMVMEGQYGKFMTMDEIDQETELSYGFKKNHKAIINKIISLGA